MDAVEFIKQVRRMGKQKGEAICFKLDEIDTDIVDRIEQWAKEHPVKTRKDEFFKQWPDAEIGDDGYPSVAPCQLYKEMEEKDENGVCCKNCGCGICRRDFWLKEIE